MYLGEKVPGKKAHLHLRSWQLSKKRRTPGKCDAWEQEKFVSREKTWTLKTWGLLSEFWFCYSQNLSITLYKNKFKTSTRLVVSQSTDFIPGILVHTDQSLITALLDAKTAHTTKDALLSFRVCLHGEGTITGSYTFILGIRSGHLYTSEQNLC